MRHQPFGHLEAFVDVHSSLESVAHVHLDQYGHVVSGRFHHFVHHHVHEPHAVFQTSAEFVFPVIGVRREELADEVAVSGMDFYGIETGFTGQTDGVAVGTCHRGEFIFPQSADEGR